MKEIIITKHGKKRLKERKGLAKRAHLRHIHTVLTKGIYSYRDKSKNIFYMIHDSMKYVFGLSPTSRPVFITVVNQQIY